MRLMFQERRSREQRRIFSLEIFLYIRSLSLAECAVVNQNLCDIALKKTLHEWRIALVRITARAQNEFVHPNLGVLPVS